MTGGGKRRAPGRKSDTFPLEQRGQRIERWPVRDREAWLAAVRCSDDPFEKPGAAAHLAEKTLRNRMGVWGNFLGFLESRGRLDPESTPKERATPKNVADWIGAVSKRTNANTTARFVIELALVLQAMEPADDWMWIRRHPLRPRNEEVLASRKPVAPFNPGKLAEFLFERCAALEARRANFTTAVTYRDAVMVLLGVYLGLRSANLACLRIGVHLQETGDTYRVDLAPEETKAGRPVSSLVPAHISAVLRTYIARFRPILRGTKPPVDALWINRDGDTLRADALRGIFVRTGRLAGIRLHPHLVRHTMATVLMAAAPMNLGLASAALTHKSARSVNDVYDRSGAETSQAIWRRLRRSLMR